jgi:GT2 family glycosyltransferase
VVLNHDGGDMTVRCLTALREVDWPPEHLDVVLVDNASADGIAERVRRELPGVRVIASPRNVGFAGGCNLALDDLAGIDYVALLNNDAVPDRNWLRPLVDALEADDRVGAANSKVLFAPSFVSVRIESGPLAGVTVTGIRVDDADVWDDSQFGVGCDTTATRGSGDDRACRLAPIAEIRIPVLAGGPRPHAVALDLVADARTTVRISGGVQPADTEVGPRGAMVTSGVVGPAFDVVNNAGSRLVAGGYSADRGLLERDCAQYDHTEEVFAWCGAAVLLSARYLRDVGLFDDRFFLYYEDTDLAWRGRLEGWRYDYVPESVVRHVHAASSREGSALFFHYNERNRFLTLARNAPWRLVVDAAYVFNRDTLVILKRDVVVPFGRGRRPSLARVRARVSAFGAFLALLPRMVASRRRQRVTASQRQAIVDRWAE